jgi:hypothetical protein
MDVKWGLASDNEEHLPERVDARVEAKTAFPRPELRLNGISGGGAMREGSNMTKFGIGMSKIESIFQDIGNGHESFTDRLLRSLSRFDDPGAPQGEKA